MRATTAFKREFVREIADRAAEASPPIAFSDALKAAARAQLKEGARGKVLVGTTSGGTAATFVLPPIGDPTPADLVELFSELRDMVDEIKAASPDITDSSLVSALLAALLPIRSFRMDHSQGVDR